MMSGYDLLIFDLDGTLVDSQYDLTAAVNDVRSGYALGALDTATIRSYVGSGVTVLLQRALPGLSASEADSARKRFGEYYLHHLLDTTKLYPGIEELLRRSSGKTKAVLTNKPEVYSRKILEGLGIAPHFAVIWGGDTGPKRKPDPDPLLQIMRQLRVFPDRTLMIGDGINDILAAHAAGVHCAGVGYGYTDRAELHRLKPDYYVDRPQELIEII